MKNCEVKFYQMLNNGFKSFLVKNEYDAFGETDFFKWREDLSITIIFCLIDEIGYRFGEKLKFKIYGHIYSTQFDKIITNNQDLVLPDRIGYLYSVSDKFFSEDGYIIDETTNIEIATSEIINTLNSVNLFFETIKSTDDLVDKMILENYFHKYIEIIKFLIINNKNQKLAMFLKEIYNKFRESDKWMDLEKKINRVLSKKLNKSIMEIIFE